MILAIDIGNTTVTLGGVRIANGNPNSRNAIGESGTASRSS